MEKITLKVTGMKCDACENLIHDALMEKDGVISVKADHQSGKVEIECDETKVDQDALKQTIVDQGFKVVGFGQQSLLDKINEFIQTLLKFFKS